MRLPAFVKKSAKTPARDSKAPANGGEREERLMAHKVFVGKIFKQPAVKAADERQ
jgi:hypothetical protein